MRRRGERRRGEVIAYRTAAGVAKANATLEGRRDPEDRPHTGQLLQ